VATALASVTPISGHYEGQQPASWAVTSQTPQADPQSHLTSTGNRGASLARSALEALAKRRAKEREARVPSPVSPTTVNGWWQRTVQAAEVRGITTHSLRHFFAPGLTADGCHVVTVLRSASPE